MRPAIIDLDWLDNRIANSIEKDVVTELKTVRANVVSLPMSFSLATLNMKREDIPSYNDEGVGSLDANSDH